jgi:TolB-like protein
MIHGVPDKLNIYVKRVLEGSVAGLDGRIRVNDHIVEVRITLADP